MAHRITLNDDDYSALAAVAARNGQPIEDLVHEAIVEYYSVTAPAKDLGAYRFPTGEPDTAQEEAEDEELANSIGPQKPWLSDMVDEDRGPR